MWHRHAPQTISPGGQVAAPSGARRFLSFKWKALLLTSLVLIAITGAFSVISYSSLINQFERQRQVTQGQYIRQIAALLEQSSQRLQQVGGILSLLTGIQAGIGASDPELIDQALRRQGSVLQIDLGIDVIRLYDRSARLLGSWGAPHPALSEHGLATGWARSVGEREYPETHLDCRRDCVQYAVLPMLVRGQTQGVALVGASLAEVVVAFNEISGSDIALLTVAQTQPGDDYEASRAVSAWQVEAAASTNADTVLPMLRHLAARQPEIGDAIGGRRVLFEGRHFEVNLKPLPGFAEAGNGYLALVEDITSPMMEINRAIRQHLTIGALGLFLSETLLLALLWTPMSHLRRTAETLPLLARSAFAEVRAVLSERSRKRWLDDEIDVLDGVAIELSYRLEELKAEIEARSWVLKRMHAQLERRVEERTRELSTANQSLTDEVGMRKRVDQALADRAEELKRSEGLLRGQTEILKSILDSMADGVIVADRHGELLLSNPAAMKISGQDPARLGFTQTAAPPTLFLDEITPYAAGELPLTRAMRGEAVDGAEAFLRQPGQPHGIWLSASARPLKDSEGVTRGAVAVFRDISERKQSEQRLAQLAKYDMLTGLPNRNLVHDRLSRAIARAKRNAQIMALMFLDLDRFKEINDTWGHSAGDLVLKGVAKRLTQCLRESDTVGRLAGDEFTMILENIDGTAGVSAVAAKIIAAFAEPLSIEAHEILITTSIGIALYPHDAETLEDLLKRADAAMYCAKKQGRNNYHFYTSATHVHAARHMIM